MKTRLAVLLFALTSLLSACTPSIVSGGMKVLHTPVKETPRVAEKKKEREIKEEEREIKPLSLSEVRGVWWSTFTSGWQNNPSSDYLRGRVRHFKSLDINSIFFQVLPKGGKSHIAELKVILDEAKKQGIEVHAWVNPYRGNTAGAYTILSNGWKWGHPGDKRTQQAVFAYVESLLSLPLRGIHVDDYFYPYPSHGSVKDGLSSTQREDAVLSLMKGLQKRVQSKGMLFTVSPLGIPLKGGEVPPHIKGMNVKETLFFDMEGVRDMGIPLIPQVYWDKTFNKIVDTWVALYKTELVGIAAYRFDKEEIDRQKAYLASKEIGWIIFSADDIQ